MMGYLQEITERKTSKLAYSVRCKRVKFLSADGVNLRADFAVKWSISVKLHLLSKSKPYPDTNNK
jgi:hypothetical protein